MHIRQVQTYGISLRPPVAGPTWISYSYISRPNSNRYKLVLLFVESRVYACCQQEDTARDSVARARRRREARVICNYSVSSSHRSAPVWSNLVGRAVICSMRRPSEDCPAHRDCSPTTTMTTRKSMTSAEMSRHHWMNDRNHPWIVCWQWETRSQREQQRISREPEKDKLGSTTTNKKTNATMFTIKTLPVAGVPLATIDRSDCSSCMSDLRAIDERCSPKSWISWSDIYLWFFSIVVTRSFKRPFSSMYFAICRSNVSTYSFFLRRLSWAEI